MTFVETYLDRHLAEFDHSDITADDGLSELLVVLVLQTEEETTHFVAIIGVDVAKFVVNVEFDTQRLLQDKFGCYGGRW